MTKKTSIDQYKDRFSCPIDITVTGKRPVKKSKSASTKKRGK